jgi:formyltetrahydrofolate-dependent phosphoribosylglycinamide formyltransferase
MTRRRAAILISGRGSNMAALLEAAAAPWYPVEFVLVLSNRPDAPGLALAARHQVSTACIDSRPFGRDRAAHEAEVVALLDGLEVDLVCLAGWMRLLTPAFVRHYAGRLLNIHPSLLPAFPGLATHERALAAGVRIHGCTVHLVTEVMDDGPILAQAAVPARPGDTPETLAARVLVQEHAIYPAALAAFAAGTEAPAASAALALRNPLPWPLPGP